MLKIATLLLVFPSHFVFAQSLSVEYHSRYVTEGRDNLQDGGIVWAHAVTPLSEHVVFDIYYGIGTSSDFDYDELIGSVIYQSETSWFEYAIGISRIEFFEDDAFDNELTLDLSRDFGQATSALSFTYSTEQNGSFAEIEMGYPIIISSVLAITPFMRVGFDFGYITPLNDTYNQTSLGVLLDYMLDTTTTVQLTAQYDISGTDIRRELGQSENQFWVLLNANYFF